MAAVYGRYERSAAKRRAWDADNPGNRAIRGELVAAVLPLVPADGRLLDVGCGTGWWLAALAAHGVPPSRLAGAELLERRVASTRRRVPGAAVDAADARELPYEDGSAALVTLFTVLSSMASDADRRDALAEARRVRAPGGLIAVWEPRLPTPNPRTQRVSRRMLRQTLGPHVAFRSLTVLPPLARRLDGEAYARLARVPPLRAHRLALARSSDA